MEIEDNSDKNKSAFDKYYDKVIGKQPVQQVALSKHRDEISEQQIDTRSRKDHLNEMTVQYLHQAYGLEPDQWIKCSKKVEKNYV